MAKRENRYYSLSYALSKIRLTGTFRELRQRFADRGRFIAYDKAYLQTARVLKGEFESPLMYFVATWVPKLIGKLLQ